MAPALAALAVMSILPAQAKPEYDFGKAWKKVNAAEEKGLPRTITNIVAEIEREANAIGRWPDAARAFLYR